MDPIEWIDRCSVRLKQHWPDLDWPDADDYACDLRVARSREQPEDAADSFVATVAESC